MSYLKEKMESKNLLYDFICEIENCEIANFFAKIDFHFSQSNIEILDLTLLNSLRKEFIYGKSSYDYYDKLKVFVQSHIKIIKNEVANQDIVFDNIEQKLIGLTIENYKIESFIGSGGFGMVFKGVHIHLRNEAAIKISYEIQDDYSEVKNLLQIGLLGVRQLEHPNIGKIFAMGEVTLFNSLRIYVIMEMIRGGSLAMLPKSSLTKKEILHRINLFIQICEVIQYAHNFRYENRFGVQVTGVMHGDIKPSNILLENENTPKIIDFMFIDLGKLQKIKIATPNFSLSKDCATMALGTLEYMPTEQEKKGIVTIQTEIFTLGATLFELFSPTQFNVIRHNFSSSFFNKEANEINENLIKTDLLTHNPNINKGISKIISKCIQENPSNRYHDVSDLIDDLQRLKSW